jgi:hypothetical protein
MRVSAFSLAIRITADDRAPLDAVPSVNTGAPGDAFGLSSFKTLRKALLGAGDHCRD